MSLTRGVVLTFMIAASAVPAHADKVEPKINLASFGAGAIVIAQPVAYNDSWSGFWLLDEDPTTGYAPPEADLAPKAFVIELADSDSISEVSFDSSHAENGGRSAKGVSVEISDKPDGGWQPLISVTLAESADNQHFPVKAPKTGRYLRLTLATNHGDPKYNELFGFGAFGKVVTKLPVGDFSGAYETQFGTFRIKASGITAIGCYEHHNGLITNAGFDGRVLRFTWSETGEQSGSGPAILVFPANGKTFLGLWWNGADPQLAGRWDGVRQSTKVGVCPHFKFAAAKPGGEVAESLRKGGRARIYGITFDTDSDHIKAESKPTLDDLLAATKAEPTWKLAIEGHTDSSGAADHNQVLSEKRAAAVKAYLVKAGVKADRLTTSGLGATKPVSSNETTLGRSQNRRVEIVKS
jgi:outer membrane protein OmpA-like peptidoglycan-associated protein